MVMLTPAACRVYGFMAEGQARWAETVLMSLTGFSPVHLAAG